MRYLLLMTYGPIHGVAPMTQWSAEEVRAHVEFQQALAARLSERGELVDAQGLAGPSAGVLVTSDGENPPVLRDGTLTDPALAGYWLIEVDTHERALEIAGEASAAPGPGGRPIEQPIEVRPLAGPPPMEG